MNAATDPRWATDPSPAWNDFAPDWSFHLDTPDDPSGGTLEQTAKLWPEVHPAEQELRPTSPSQSENGGRRPQRRRSGE